MPATAAEFSVPVFETVIIPSSSANRAFFGTFPDRRTSDRSAARHSRKLVGGSRGPKMEDRESRTTWLPQYQPRVIPLSATLKLFHSETLPPLPCPPTCVKPVFQFCQCALLAVSRSLRCQMPSAYVATRTLSNSNAPSPGSALVEEPQECARFSRFEACISKKLVALCSLMVMHRSER